MFNHLTYAQLRHLCGIFKELTGIEYNKDKIYLFENRLSKLVGVNKEFATYDELIVALGKKHKKQLKEEFINLLTTNYSYFFREAVHFRFLQYIVKNKFSDIPELRVWSAAASGGQEAYSIAMTLNSLYRGRENDFKILGTDIARDKIKTAQQGLYHAEEIEGHIHPSVIKKNFIPTNNDYQIVDRIKSHVKFAPLNIMGVYPFTKQFHIIFLRNVLIYFKAKEKEQIIRNMVNYLHPDGYLIASTSESLSGLDVPLKHISHSIYIHTKKRHIL